VVTGAEGVDAVGKPTRGSVPVVTKWTWMRERERR
jgi:hypothetical protein